MRILVMINVYPPFELGGMGRSCLQVVEELSARGHDVRVLTSMHGTGNVPKVENGIHRKLFLEMDFTPWRHLYTFLFERRKREKHNLEVLEDLIYEWQPEVIFVWGLWNLHRSLATLAEELCPGRVAYRFSEYWPTLPSQHALYWQTAGRRWYSRLPKKLIGYIAQAIQSLDEPLPKPKFENAMCVSAATRAVLVNAGIPVEDARIIHTGLDITKFGNGLFRDSAVESHHSLSLLYAGRLRPDKGVETAIEAIAYLVHHRGAEKIHLDFAGSGNDEYVDHLKKLVDKAEVSSYVSFLGRIPPEHMPALMNKHDILVVPSLWPEPFARVVLEGMITGMVVLATDTGGTGEIVKDGENGLFFTAGDAVDLAEKIISLGDDNELRDRLSRAGRETVLREFTVEKMMDQIEEFLLEVAGETVKPIDKSFLTW